MKDFNYTVEYNEKSNSAEIPDTANVYITWDGLISSEHNVRTPLYYAIRYGPGEAVVESVMKTSFARMLSESEVVTTCNEATALAACKKDKSVS